MSKPMKKVKPICKHDKPENWKGTLLFRCACGNVWTGEKFFGSVPQDQSAVSILGAFSLGAAPQR